jgi:UDP-N-acetylmuramoyl-L-alanyl-D-glutamate--2,6-diaminopimelate ligase
MKLSDLLPDGVAGPAATPAIEISGLTADSRAVAPGFLFAALAGSRTDGARFVADRKISLQ